MSAATTATQTAIGRQQHLQQHLMVMQQQVQQQHQLLQQQQQLGGGSGGDGDADDGATATAEDAAGRPAGSAPSQHSAQAFPPAAGPSDAADGAAAAAAQQLAHSSWSGGAAGQAAGGDSFSQLLRAAIGAGSDDLAAIQHIAGRLSVPLVAETPQPQHLPAQGNDSSPVEDEWAATGTASASPPLLPEELFPPPVMHEAEGAQRRGVGEPPAGLSESDHAGVPALQQPVGQPRHVPAIRPVALRRASDAAHHAAQASQQPAVPPVAEVGVGVREASNSAVERSGQLPPPSRPPGVLGGGEPSAWVGFGTGSSGTEPPPALEDSTLAAGAGDGAVSRPAGAAEGAPRLLPRGFFLPAAATAADPHLAPHHHVLLTSSPSSGFSAVQQRVPVPPPAADEQQLLHAAKTGLEVVLAPQGARCASWDGGVKEDDFSRDRAAPCTGAAEAPAGK